MLPLSRTKDLVLQELDDEILLYDHPANKAVCVNKTSSLVWRNCDGRTSPQSITAEIGGELRADLGEDVILFPIQQLEKAGLLDQPAKHKNEFRGLSRREIVKRIGISSAVAFQIVTSLIVPTAAHAQS